MNIPIGTLRADAMTSDPWDFFGAPPLLSNEDKDRFNRMFLEFKEEIKPEDVFESLIPRDLAYSRMEIERYQRLIAKVFDCAVRRRIREKIEDCENDIRRRAEELTEAAVSKWETARCDETKSAEELDKIEASINAQLTADIAQSKAEYRAEADRLQNHKADDLDYAEVFSDCSKEVHQLEILLEAAEARYKAALKSLERHKKGIGRVLRERADRIMKGELVDPPLLTDKTRL